MTLTASDRCDRCNAQAYFRFIFDHDSGQDLLFCRHHGMKWQNPLLNLAVDLEDETHLLFDSVSKPEQDTD